MYPKFIIVTSPGETEGFLRMGMAINHKDLIVEYEKVHGGGWWSKNDEKKEIILYGSSGDYGHPDFRFLNVIERKYIDYTFIYTPHISLPGNVLDLSSVRWIPTAGISGLKDYINQNIIPEYDNFDGAHRRDHVNYVIEQSLELAKHYDVDKDMVYAIAAYHDTGLEVDRKTHHLESGKIVRSDENLRKWFTPEQIEIMAQAVEDHRASNKQEPRSIYGKIVAEADRQIDAMTIIRRTIQFGLSHNPELDREGHWRRTLEHLNEKYGEGGYLCLWIPESPNAARLEEFRRQLKDLASLRRTFDDIYDSLI